VLGRIECVISDEGGEAENEPSGSKVFQTNEVSVTDVLQPPGWKVSKTSIALEIEAAAEAVAELGGRPCARCFNVENRPVIWGRHKYGGNQHQDLLHSNVHHDPEPNSAIDIHVTLVVTLTLTLTLTGPNSNPNPGPNFDTRMSNLSESY